MGGSTNRPTTKGDTQMDKIIRRITVLGKVFTFKEPKRSDSGEWFAMVYVNGKADPFRTIIAGDKLSAISEINHDVERLLKLN